MADDERTIEELIESTTRHLREQLVESPAIMGKTDLDGMLYRYSFAMGSLLAFAPEGPKAELIELIRNGLPAEVEA